MFDSDKKYWDRATEFIKGLEYVSCSILQRQFRITYMTAGRLIDEMVRKGLVSGKKDNAGRHLVLKGSA